MFSTLIIHLCASSPCQDCISPFSLPPETQASSTSLSSMKSSWHYSFSWPMLHSQVRPEIALPAKERDMNSTDPANHRTACALAPLVWSNVSPRTCGNTVYSMTQYIHLHCFIYGHSQTKIKAPQTHKGPNHVWFTPITTIYFIKCWLTPAKLILSTVIGCDSKFKNHYLKSDPVKMIK